MPQIYNAGNDFIQAYLQGVQTRLAQEKEAREKQQFLDELPLKKKHMEALVDAEHQRGEAARAEIGSHVENLKHQVMSDFATGMRQPSANSISLNPQVGINTSQNVGQDNLPTAQQNLGIDLNPTVSQDQTVDVDKRLVPEGQINLHGVSFPSDMRKQKLFEVLLEAQKAGLIEQAKLPSELSKIGETNKGRMAVAGAEITGRQNVADTTRQGNMDVANVNNSSKSEIADAATKAALERTKLTVGGTIAAANIHAAATRYTADHKTSSALDPEVISNAAMLSALGESSTPGYTNTGMAVKNSLVKAKLIPFDPKDAAKLKAVSDVGALMDYMASHIKDLPEGGIGAFIQKQQAKVPGTDVANIYQNVFGRAANISHTYGGEIGRLSDPDVQRAMGILAAPGITKDQALKNLVQLKVEAASKVFNNLLAGQSPQQQLMVLEHNKFDPESFMLKGSDNQLHPKFLKGKDGRWGIFDPKTVSYSALHGEN